MPPHSPLEKKKTILKPIRTEVSQDCSNCNHKQAQRQRVLRRSPLCLFKAFVDAAQPVVYIDGADKDAVNIVQEPGAQADEGRPNGVR